MITLLILREPKIAKKSAQKREVKQSKVLSSPCTTKFGSFNFERIFSCPTATTNINPHGTKTREEVKYQNLSIQEVQQMNNMSLSSLLQEIY